METFKPDLDHLNSCADLLKALAHPVRLCIVHGLLSNDGCNVSHIQQCLQLPQSTVSQHLTRLKSAGIIKGERHGLEVHYRVASTMVATVVQVIMQSEPKV
jgi:ArsR family transcriptional regulator